MSGFHFLQCQHCGQLSRRTPDFWLKPRTQVFAFRPEPVRAGRREGGISCPEGQLASKTPSPAEQWKAAQSGPSLFAMMHVGVRALLSPPSWSSDLSPAVLSGTVKVSLGECADFRMQISQPIPGASSFLDLSCRRCCRRCKLCAMLSVIQYRRLLYVVSCPLST